MVFENSESAPSGSTSREFDLDERGVRLLHASDLHLERVPAGLADAPDHLRDELIDAAYTAAERVFEAAIAEQVDAVLLAGDVVDLALAGPRAVVFLREQFEQLAAEGIKVYWAGGRVDLPHAWPKVAPLPSNVHVFPAEHIESCEIHRDGELIACICGISSGGEAQQPLSRFTPHEDGVLTIGVTYGQFSRADVDAQRVPYVACGGRHERKSWAAPDRSRLLHYAGATFGASFEESGPHGATLVSIDAEGTITTVPIATDPFRWETPHLEIDDTTDVGELERRLVARAEELRASAGAANLLVRWRLTGSGPLVDSLRRDDAAQRMVDMLRERFGRETPSLWATGIDVRRDAGLPPAFYDEETILGDVLREIRKLRDEPQSSLALASYLVESDRSGPMSHCLLALSPERHETLLDETSDQCVALLSGNPS